MSASDLEAGGRQNSRALMQSYQQSHARCSQRDYDPSFGVVFSRGDGSRLWDVDENEWIDLTSGYAATNFGHAFQPLVSVASQQLYQLTHLTGGVHPGRIELAQQLLSRFGNPTQESKVIFNASGARAVETSWKAAMAYRPGKVVALAPNFHGRSIATSWLGESCPGFDGGSQALVWPESEYAHCAHCSLNLEYPACGTICQDALLGWLREHSPEVSAVIVEPAATARGYIFPPAECHHRLRRLADEHGFLIIADEIQTGLGRCGGWALSHLQGWYPDLLLLGKSLGGGITPISAVVGSADVLDAISSGAESETFAATPLACAIGLEVLRLLDDGELFKRGMHLGKSLRDAARRCLKQAGIHRNICSPRVTVGVEGAAATCVLDFANPEIKRADSQAGHDASGSDSGEPWAAAQAMAQRFAISFRDQKLKVHLSGTKRTRIVMLPALTMSEAELGDAVRRMGQAIDEAVALLASDCR